MNVRFVRLTKGVTASAAACQKLKKGQKARGHKSCQLRTDVGSLTAPPAGTSSFKFNGKVGGHKLKPGSYLLVMTATDAAGNVSKPKTAHLKILPPKR